MGRGNLQSMLRDIDTKTKIQFPQMWETSKPCQSFPTDWLSSTKQSQPLKQAAILHHCIHLPREADNINTLISKYNILIEMQSHMLVKVSINNCNVCICSPKYKRPRHYNKIEIRVIITNPSVSSQPIIEINDKQAGFTEKWLTTESSKLQNERSRQKSCFPHWAIRSELKPLLDMRQQRAIESTVVCCKSKQLHHINIWIESKHFTS